ncbi:hypothetical protein, partial [Vibrio vulnificus]|uniref:hypothetical protein n=1 Tax=Vibrio vulnificus TaxID=672 RepID=UPI0035C84D99
KIKLIADLPELQAHRKYSFILQAHNAALRGECRLNQLPADRLHHQSQPHTKNATRHESHLNALL